MGGTLPPLNFDPNSSDTMIQVSRSPSPPSFSSHRILDQVDKCLTSLVLQGHPTSLKNSSFPYCGIYIPVPSGCSAVESHGIGKSMWIQILSDTSKFSQVC
jgi:hypothetical protein